MKPVDDINILSIQFRQAVTSDLENLLQYLHHLSDHSKSRFGPHPFTKEALELVLSDTANYKCFIALENTGGNIIAYAIIKMGFLEHDRVRLEQYGLTLSAVHDSTFAPSVADAWQGRGIGKKMFLVIVDDLKNTAVKRIILWGGVQSSNHHAVNYYTKNGFTILGAFEYHGQNLDMLYQLA